MITLYLFWQLPWFTSVGVSSGSQYENETSVEGRMTTCTALIPLNFRLFFIFQLYFYFFDSIFQLHFSSIASVLSSFLFDIVFIFSSVCLYFFSYVFIFCFFIFLSFFPFPFSALLPFFFHDFSIKMYVHFFWWVHFEFFSKFSSVFSMFSSVFRMLFCFVLMFSFHFHISQNLFFISSTTVAQQFDFLSQVTISFLLLYSRFAFPSLISTFLFVVVLHLILVYYF